MPAPQTQGLSDEQVEELLQALLDFRSILMGLNDRFQNRMALLEKEFAEQRSTPAVAPRPGTGPLPRPGTGPLPRPGTGSLRRPGTGPLAAPPEPEPDVLPEPDDEIEAMAFKPEEAESFSIVDIDDEDDDF